MPIISVIVPVYKGEKYLSECIESILCQSFRDFELLLLDDGSPDRSGEICDEYAKKDSRIRVIHKVNEGVNATRKAGVLAAKGEWVTFCDADDTMPVFALEHLYSLHQDTDVVIGFPDTPINNKVLNLDECRRNIMIGRLLPQTPWAKLFRREILTEQMFDFPRDIYFGEDMIMNIRIMFSINRAPHILFEKVYNYRRTPISVSHTKKASLDYEFAFDLAREQSIPAELLDDYMKEICWSRINGINKVAYESPELVAEGSHEFIKKTTAGVKKYGYRLNLQEWLLLNSSNKQVVKFAAFLRVLRNFLRYRLGWNN